MNHGDSWANDKKRFPGLERTFAISPQYVPRHLRKDTKPRRPATICGHCDGLLRLDKDIKVREHEFEEYGPVNEMGIECPNCGHWYHSTFEDEQLRQLRDVYRRKRALAIKYPKKEMPQDRAAAALAEFRAYMTKLNDALREKLGIVEAYVEVPEEAK